LEKFLNIWARLYDSFINWIFYSPCGGEGRFRGKCLDFVSPAKGEGILDVCCGSGMFTYMIASRAGLDGQVIGVDLCKSALEIARNQPSAFPLKFLKANAKSLPFASSKFNKCLIIFGLHHMPRQTRHKTLSEIHRTLIPTGSLFVVEYNLPDRAIAKLVAKALVKLDKSKEAYTMLLNHSLPGDIEQVGFSIKRREFMYKGAVQLIEARKLGKPIHNLT
jgi:demethylmenaquinone methyltransferase/2-methoxy-6-polyprenyl-1,4-benzoquinol methylase